jgi:hypothetical protein
VKNKLKVIVLLTLTQLMFGCGSTGGLGHIKPGSTDLISIGMTKDEVIHKLGKPESTNADGQSETLSYILERPWWQDKPFHVKIVDGKVTSYELIDH